jgi:hypothetical protein
VDFIDRVSVVRRGNMVAFLDEKVEGNRSRGKATEALIKERERQLTAEERSYGLRDLEKLEGQDAEAAGEIMGLLEPLLKDEVEAYPELCLARWDFSSLDLSTGTLYARVIAIFRNFCTCCFRPIPSG